MKTSLKNNNGITLVALVITIIILIILATVAISFAFGSNGLINRAEDASEMYANDSSYTEGSITNVEAYINDILIGNGGSGEEPEEPTEPEAPIKVEDVKGGDAFDTITTVEDAEGNKIVVPAGFKIASDSGNTVQQGIVIEDVSASTDAAVQGSQFVWIPVGVFIKDGGTPSNEIILGRYTFVDDGYGTPELHQAAYTTGSPNNYTKEMPIIVNSVSFIEIPSYRAGIINDENRFEDLNATAKDLKAFVESTKKNGGYYIGRYEASFASGNSSDYATCKSASKKSTSFSREKMEYTSGQLWDFISQLNISKVAINTYADSSSVKSDMMNSYAWDTALVYIQEAGNTNYSYYEGNLINNNLTNTGTGQDEVCKINDMASNLIEWTTEYNDRLLAELRATPCSFRGSYYEKPEYHSFTANRGTGSTHAENNLAGFRIVLYF